MGDDSRQKDNFGLEDVRSQIDDIDLKIQDLLNERAKCAEKVADIKLSDLTQEASSGIQTNLFYRPEREAQVLRKIADRNDGPMKSKALVTIFREIMSACLSLEKPLQISYLGPQGTFSQAAALKHFGHAVECKPVSTIDEVFAHVESGQSDFGVVPVENSTEGMVNNTLDNFMDSPLKISGEVEVRIEHHLLVSSLTKESGVSKICAHEQGLAQCRNWLDLNYPRVDRQSLPSNGAAAKLAAENVGIAAVAGGVAQEEYKLERISSNIEDNGDNTTRFLIVGSSEIPHSGEDKTSILVSSRNKPGALYKILDPFQRSNISLTRIDTRPSRTEKWTYVFFIEFEGHLQDDKVKSIMKELEENSLLLKPLGSYPRSLDW